MPSVMSGILDGIAAILEGTATDVGRAMPTGRFRQVEASGELFGAAAAAGAEQPFTLEVEDLTDGPDMPATVAGTYVHGSHLVTLTIYYAVRRVETYILLKEIQDDEADVRKSLGWPLAWAEISGWTGLEFLGSALELRGESDPPDLLANIISLRVAHREDWG